MRILMVNYEFPPVGGGGATANYYLAREMVRAGHEVTVVTSYFAGLPLEETVAGIRVLRVKLRRKRRDFTKFHEMLQYVLFAIPKLRRLCRREHFDVVHTFFAVPSGPAGHVASRTARAPHVIRLGGGDLPGHDPGRFGALHTALKPVVRWLLRRADARVVNSQGLCEKAEGLYPGLRFDIVPNGIDLEEFTPGGRVPSRATRHPAPMSGHGFATDGPPTLLFVSRLIERKGLQYLLPALARLRDEGVSFRLLVAGDGPMRPQLEQQTRELGLETQVEFLGLIERENLPAVYARGEVFVLPSVSEGMPNVVLEAIACGLPIVGTAVPGMAELVQEGVNGYIVPPGAVDVLVDPLRRLLTDRALREAQGVASREHAQGCGWAAMAAKYLAIYETAIRERGGERA